MIDKKNIIDVEESDFNTKIIEASETDLIVVDFWAPWCGPCKQLTPLLEKIVSSTKGKVILAKVNIDENQQIASQLRIQSIPTVMAFKNKQIVNAFQGVISEKQILEFIEKSLGEKLEEDFSDFYSSVEEKMKRKEFHELKEILLEFISNNIKEIKGIGLYLTCLIELKEYEEFESFVASLDDETRKNIEVESVIKRQQIIKKNISGPNVEKLHEKLKKNPNDIGVVIEISNKLFSDNEYDEAFKILLDYYPNNKEKVKKKILEFFEALGSSHEATSRYRKKFSQIMFS